MPNVLIEYMLAPVKFAHQQLAHHQIISIQPVDLPL